MKFAVAGLLAFGAAALAQSVEYDFLYSRDALMDSDDMFDDAEFWTRDAELDFDDWMEDGLSARDLDVENDGAITRIFWTREAKKGASDNWTPPKINIPKGDKIIKDTFKCNKKKETCSGQIDLQGPA